MTFIPLSSQTFVEFTPPSLIRYVDDKPVIDFNTPVFFLRQPGLTEQEQLSARMLSLGLTTVTTTTIRSTMIECLFELMKEEEAEAAANLLDTVWQLDSVHSQAMALWAEQETQRLLDQQAGAPAREPQPQPPRLISVRDGAKANLLIERLKREAPRVRDLMAERMDWDRQHNLMLVRVGVARAKGNDIPTSLEFLHDALTQTSVVAIRDAIGRTAWTELVTEIDRLYTVSGEEEKNSGSPVGKPPGQIGSTGQSDDPAPSDGNSTGSYIGLRPADESETTIEPSSAFTSAPGGQTASPGQMDVV